MVDGAASGSRGILAQGATNRAKARNWKAVSHASYFTWKCRVENSTRPLRCALCAYMCSRVLGFFYELKLRNDPTTKSNEELARLFVAVALVLEVDEDGRANAVAARQQKIAHAR